MSCLAVALWSSGCTGPLDVSDYDAGAVVRGVVRLASGEPLTGARVDVAVHRSGCHDEGSHASGGGVFTESDGSFEGDFSFLATGPVDTECVEIEFVDTLTSTVVGDTVIAAALRFDAARSDTLEVDLVF